MVSAPPPPEQASGVYLHFPFCATRCTYCDFPTVAGRDGQIDASVRAQARVRDRVLPRA